MPANQWALRLAQHIINTLHGEVPEKVFQHLASHGLQNLGETIRGCGLPPAQVKQAIMLLIQHNYVSVYMHKEEEGLRATPRPPAFLYYARVEDVLNVLRHPRFLLHVQQDAGADAKDMVELLLQNGRLTFDQISEAMSVARNSSLGEGEPPAWTPESTRNLLMSLVNARYIERAPPCNLPPPSVALHPNAIKQRRGARTGGDTAAEQAAALRSLEEVKYDHLRFKIPNDVLFMIDQEAPPAADEEAAPAGGGAERTGAEGEIPVKEEPMEEGGGDTSDMMAASPPPISPAGGRGRGRGRGRGSIAAGRGTKRSAGDEGTAAGKEGTPEPPAKKQRIKAGTAKPQAAPTAAGAAAALKAKALEQATEAAQEVAGRDSVLWRVNSEELNRRLRHAAIYEMALDRFGSEIARVLQAMMAAGRNYETKVKEEHGAPLSVDEITAHLRMLWQERRRREKEDEEEARRAAAADGGSAQELMQLVKEEEERDAADLMAMEELCGRVQEHVNTLCQDDLEFVSYQGDGPAGPQYSINMLSFLNYMCLKHLESAARNKFGEGGLRIFKMLLLKGQLEQKQVAEFTMLAPKDTRELLYRMLKGGFVFLQDIPKTADRAPSRTFYTWRADYYATTERYAIEQYRAAGNVWARLQVELERNKEVMDLFKEAKATGQLTHSLTMTQRQQIARMVKVIRVLDAALCQLDESIALFSTF